MPDGLDQRQYFREVLRIADTLIRRGSERGMDLELCWRVPHYVGNTRGELELDPTALAHELGLTRDVILHTEIDVLPRGAS